MGDDTVPFARGGGPRKARIGSGLGRLGQLLDRGRDLFRPCLLLVSLWLGHLCKNCQVRYPQVLGSDAPQVSRCQLLQAGQVTIFETNIARDGGEEAQLARVALHRLLVVDAITLQDGARLGQLLLRHLFVRQTQDLIEQGAGSLVDATGRKAGGHHHEPGIARRKQVCRGVGHELAIAHDLEIEPRAVALAERDGQKVERWNVGVVDGRGVKTQK